MMKKRTYSILLAVILVINTMSTQAMSNDSLNYSPCAKEKPLPFWKSTFYYTMKPKARDQWMFFTYFLGSEVIATAAHFLPQYALAKFFGAEDAKLNFLLQRRDNRWLIEFFHYDPTSVSRIQNATISTIGFAANQLIYKMILNSLNRGTIPQSWRRAAASLALISRLDLPNIIFWDYIINGSPKANDPKNFREAVGIPHWPIVLYTVVHLVLHSQALLNLFYVGLGKKGLIETNQSVVTQLLVKQNSVLLQLSLKLQ